MMTPATARPRFSVLPDFFSLDRETCPRIEPINERNPAVTKIVAREVTNAAIARPLPAFASCSDCDNGATGDWPPGMNSLTLRLVNYSGLDPKVAKCAVALGEVEDDFDNYPGYQCDT